MSETFDACVERVKAEYAELGYGEMGHGTALMVVGTVLKTVIRHTGSPATVDELTRILGDE